MLLNRLLFLVVGVIALCSTEENSNAAGYNRAGWMMMKLGMVAEAVEQFNKALQLSNDNETSKNVHLALANAFIVGRNFSAAIDHFQEAFGVRTYYELLTIGGRIAVNERSYNTTNALWDAAVKKGIMGNTLQRPGAGFEPSLKSQAWWDPSPFRFTSILESNHGVIREELQEVMKKRLFKKAGTRKGSGLDSEVVKGEWLEFVLYNRGKPVEENLKLCPKTAEVLKQIPEVSTMFLGQVQFSLVTPGSAILPHFGPTNYRLTAHLALIIPPKNFMRVGTEVKMWEEGKVLLFDDSYEHEVWNHSDQDRVVMVFNTWHPELTKEKQEALLGADHMRKYLP